MKDSYCKLMLVTQCGSTITESYLAFVEQCAQAGITALQLREKTMSYDERVTFGHKLKKILDLYSVPLIVNDSVDLALELDAHGVHLGQTDGDPYEARNRLGSEKIIGISVNRVEELKVGNIAPINYIGISAVFPTINKPDTTTIWGLQGIRKLSRLSIHPAIAIGGITSDNATEVIEAGASGVAVIGAVHDAPDPAAAVQALSKAIDKGHSSTLSLNPIH